MKYSAYEPALPMTERKLFKNRILPFLTFIIFLYPSLITPQVTDIYFDHIFQEQGLSQSIVKCITEDARGLMYFGTEDGLNIYDGYRFSILRNIPLDTNSLSYNDVNILLKDRENTIWAGTFNSGLNRYYPSSGKIIRFYHDAYNDNSLSNNNITALAEDKSGALWIGTDNGLCRLDKNSGVYRFTRYFHSHSKNSLYDNRIIALMADHEGAVWTGTAAGLNKIVLDGTEPRFMRLKSKPGDKSFFGSKLIRTIYEDKNFNIWIGTDEGLVMLKREQNKTVLHTGYEIDEVSEAGYDYTTFAADAQNVNSLSHNEVYAVNEDNTGVIWIGTNGGGISLYNPASGKFTNFRNDPFNSGSLCYNEIRSIYRSGAGVIWIGTYGSGISKVSREGGQFNRYLFRPDDPGCLSHPIVWSIYEDTDSILWIGTHAGLDRLDRKLNKYTHYRHNPSDPGSISSQIIRVIMDDGSGNLWLGTHGGGISIFNKKSGRCTPLQHNPKVPGSLASNSVRAVFKDASGTIWVGTYGMGLDRYNPSDKTFTNFRNSPLDNQSLSNNFVRIILEDHAGNLWIGTEGGGVNRFDRSTGKFKSYTSQPGSKNSISSNYVFSIQEDSYNNLWLGTWGGGLNMFDPAEEKFKYFTDADGLPNNSIYGILEDDYGNLWMSSNYGLSKFNPKQGVFTNYNVKDGLQDNEFNGGSYYKSKSGEMFFGGINGFNSFFPDRIKNNRNIPPVILTSFQKMNREVEFGRNLNDVDEIELDYEENVLAFEFAALDYWAPEKNKYAYMLKGFDKKWNFVNASKRFAHYTGLPPGEYQFIVKGSNSDGIWNSKAAAVKLIITPPFWRTSWFIGITALLMLGSGLLLYRRRLNIIGMQAELKAAHDAQMSIMPLRDPVVKGLDISGICIPANEVGGDFFDYFNNGCCGGRMGLFIGDVSGKAMKSAITAVLTSGVIMSCTSEADDIPSIFNKVNNIIYSKTEKSVFVAACIILIDAGSDKISYVNAGNVNPLIKSNGRVTELPFGDVRYPLGLLADVKYNQINAPFKPGDILFLITDGVIEAQSKGKELYGLSRLNELLLNTDMSGYTASQIKDIILNDIRLFTGGRIHYDDMTIVVIKRTEFNQ